MLQLHGGDDKFIMMLRAIRILLLQQRMPSSAALHLAVNAAAAAQRQEDQRGSYLSFSFIESAFKTAVPRHAEAHKL